MHTLFPRMSGVAGRIHYVQQQRYCSASSLAPCHMACLSLHPADISVRSAGVRPAGNLFTSCVRLNPENMVMEAGVTVVGDQD